MNAVTPDEKGRIAALGREVAAGRLIPYLGPGVLELGDAEPPIPTTPRALCAALTTRVGVPGRIRHNLWSSAQYIETQRHRKTLEKIFNEIFAPTMEPNALHRWLAGLDTLPLIVDTWYDGTMAAALTAAGRKDWGQVQGVTRNGEWRDIWTRFFWANGNEAAAEEAGDWTTVLYKPHGSTTPAPNYLISDSDYVEVLTEIDIQTPIPDIVKDIRTTRGFLFLGCRFYDQMLRTFARQIAKRSAGPSYAILPLLSKSDGDGGAEMTRNELKFLAEINVTPIHLPLAEAVDVLAGAAPATA
jgi:hypothetical protein